MNQTNTKVRYSIDKSGFFAEGAVILLVLSAVFRVIGCWGLWSDRVFALMQILLPIGCCALLVLCILLFGRKGFFLSCIPVLLGVVFFIFKALGFSSWLHTVLCILLYMLVAVLYTATVFGWIRTKWLLPPLFALPFLYHIFVEDLPALSDTARPVSFAAGMQEMSVLCIMAAMFCIGMGLKKRTTPAVVEAEPVEPEIVEPEIVEPEIVELPDAEPAPAEAEPPVSETVEGEIVEAPAPESAPAPEAVPEDVPPEAASENTPAPEQPEQEEDHEQ